MDFKKLLNNIKKNINSVEEDNYSNNTLKEICDDFTELVEKAKLFLLSEKDCYYGFFLLNLELEVDFFFDGLAAVSIASTPKLIANPLLLCKLNLKELLYVICHEFDHLVFNHPTEFAKKFPNGGKQELLKFNLASDAAVNDNLDNEIYRKCYRFLRQPDGLITSESFSQLFSLRGVTAGSDYAYYYALIKDKDVFKALGVTEEEFDLIISESAYNTQRKPITEKNRNKYAEYYKGYEENEYPEYAEWLKNFINDVYELIPYEQRLNMPGYFTEQIELINEPPAIIWQDVLKKQFASIISGKRKTRMRLNRRQPERFDLSGTMDSKTLKIVIAVDTSGSISSDDYSHFFNEIFAILNRNNFDITIVECDCEVNKVYKVKNRKDVQMTVIGDGGTFFTPVIEMINDDKYYRDAILIYFTDGGGEEKIPKPLTKKNFWITVGEKEHFSLKEPYGIVLEM